MELQEGKNIENFLAGKVKHPVSEKGYQAEVLRHGIPKLRSILKKTLGSEMNRIRRDQIEKNPSNPKGVFAKNLLADLDEALGDVSDVEEGERYELRFYSSVNTALDYLGSFDCWVELYDLKKEKSLADCKIDITRNPNKTFPRNFADVIFYFNDHKYINDQAKGHIDKSFFGSAEYQALIDKGAKLISEKANLRLSH